VAGFSVSNVVADLAGPCVQVVVVAIALTVVSPANERPPCQVNHRPRRGR
jgi:hypothetical protein